MTCIFVYGSVSWWMCVCVYGRVSWWTCPLRRSSFRSCSDTRTRTCTVRWTSCPHSTRSSTRTSLISRYDGVTGDPTVLVNIIFDLCILHDHPFIRNYHVFYPFRLGIKMSFCLTLWNVLRDITELLLCVIGIHHHAEASKFSPWTVFMDTGHWTV